MIIAKRGCMVLKMEIWGIWLWRCGVFPLEMGGKRKW